MMNLSGLKSVGAFLTGAGAGVIGFAKMEAHHADPFSSAWCRSPLAPDAPLFSVVNGEPLLLGHCWGCYVAAVGVAVMVASLWRAARGLSFGADARAA